MKKLKLFFPIAGVILGASLLIAFNEDYLFKINKSFEIFGQLFRDISSNYVDEIDPEELMKFGIDGMLDHLDPYTVYYDESDAEDIDILTSGSYTGLGITVGVQDSMLTIIGIRAGYSANKQGLRIGDRIYKIDTSVVINKDTKDLREFTRGNPGSKVHVFIIRDGLRDTLSYTLTRDQIKIENVTFRAVLKNDIGYIKLERFSRGAADEVREAINYLNSKDSLRGLILDLRDNPGGLLEEAVSVCELFVPEGKVIVSTKGRTKSSVFTYRSNQKPIVPNLPLAVLISETSASASEIVAGAIQDLDRGIIIGKRSFGKGLVQSVFDLPYKASLKITTAKYYTPSGRCIQKLDFLRKHLKYDHAEEMTDTAMFYTSRGRPVVELKGIIPDSTLKDEDLPEFIADMERHNVFFDFANVYASKYSSLPEDFELSPKTIDEFISFVSKKKPNYKSSLLNEVDRLRSLADSSKMMSTLEPQIQSLEKNIRKEEIEKIRKHSRQISDILEKEILTRFKNENEMTALNLVEDRSVSTASELLTTRIYRKILALDNTVPNPVRN